MIRVSDLYVYPIKSLTGLRVAQAVIEEQGFRYDRRFTLVTPAGDCMTQHRYPQLAMLDVALVGEQYLRVWHRHRPEDVLELPLVPHKEPAGATVLVRIWDDADVPAQTVSTKADRWFSTTLNEPCRLVFMPSSTQRAVDPAFARHGERVSFADGYPYLLIGQSSLDDLNRRLSQQLAMARFRPNIVVSGSQCYEEETWEQFQLGTQPFYRGDVCGRCVLTTLDPHTGQKGPEPLRTLATYRQQGNKIVFGQYVLAETGGMGRLSESDTESIRHNDQVIRVGQPVRIMSRLYEQQSAPA